MSEEKEVVKDPEKAPENQEKKPGTEWVDFDQIPEGIRGPIEERFKRIYGHNKQSERVISQLVQDHKAVIAKLDSAEKERAVKNLDEKLDTLRGEKTKALQSADYEKAAQIDEEIIDLKIPKESKPEPKKEPEQYQFSDEEKTALLSWATEKDSEGGVLRPWANPSHSKHARAIEMATAVLHDPDFRDGGMDNVLKEVDRLMDAPKAVRKQPTVLSGESVRHETKEIKLTEEQKLVARKMGMAPEDYAKAMKKYGRVA